MAETCTQTEFARRHGVSQPYINRLIKQGRITALQDKKILVAEADKEMQSIGPKVDSKRKEPTVRPSIKKKDRKSQSGSGAAKNSTSVQPETKDGAEGSEYGSIRVVHEKIKAEKARIELERLKQKLVPIETVEQIWMQYIGNCRARILNLPTQTAADLMSCESMHEMESTLRLYITAALDELKTFNPFDYVP